LRSDFRFHLADMASRAADVWLAKQTSRLRPFGLACGNEAVEAAKGGSALGFDSSVI
jgi:hypothetical protein